MTIFSGGAAVKFGASCICRVRVVVWSISSRDLGVVTLVVYLVERFLATIDGVIARFLCRFGCGALYQLLADAPSELILVTLVVGSDLYWL